MKPKYSSYKSKLIADAIRFFTWDDTRITIQLPKKEYIKPIENNVNECEHCKIYLSKCYCED